MRATNYLNGILTVLAVLLALQLWVSWHGTAGEAASLSQPAYGQGIPDGGQQRAEIVDLLKQLNVKVDDMQGLLSSGELTVRVELVQRAQE